jgi:hypothetical protein
MTRQAHSDARTREVIQKADAAGFELNNRAQWLLHNVVLHPGSSLVHEDDDQAALFSRSLEQQLEVLERPKPDLPLASGTELLPVTTIDSGAASFRWFWTDDQGEWRYGAAGGGDDLPTASLSGAEQTGKLQIAYGAIGYTNEDLRNFSFAGRGNLPSMLQNASWRGRAQLQDKSLAWGVESLGLYPLFRYPGSTIVTAADNGAGSTDWFDKTVDQIVTDIGALLDTISDATNDLRSATMVLWSRRMDKFLRRRRITDTTTGTGITFFEYIMKVFVTGGSVPNGPDLPPPENPVMFRWVRYMDGRNERSEKDGVPQLPVVGGNRTDSMFAYIHNDAAIVSKVETSMTSGTFGPPERRGVKTMSAGEAKWGGVRCTEVVTLARMDGCFGNAA